MFALAARTVSCLVNLWMIVDAESARKLGYDKLKDRQIEAVKAFVGGSDVFVSLPTGYGKSVIYAVLPTVFDTLRGESEYFYMMIYNYTGCRNQEDQDMTTANLLQLCIECIEFETH